MTIALVLLAAAVVTGIMAKVMAGASARRRGNYVAGLAAKSGLTSTTGDPFDMLASLPLTVFTEGGEIDQLVHGTSSDGTALRAFEYLDSGNEYLVAMAATDRPDWPRVHIAAGGEVTSDDPAFADHIVTEGVRAATARLQTTQVAYEAGWVVAWAPGNEVEQLFRLLDIVRTIRRATPVDADPTGSR